MSMKRLFEQLEPLKDLNCDFIKNVSDSVEKWSNHQFENPDLSLFFEIKQQASPLWGHNVAKQFLQWRKGNAPSLVELFLSAAQFFRIDTDHKYIPVALTASILGDIENNNPYHDNAHFREVFMMICALTAVHNRMNTNPLLQLSDNDILILLTAAAIHDFAHDGLGNTVDGIHIPSRLELKAVEKAKPFFKALGVTDKLIDDIQMLIISTDITRGINARSPAGIARDIYLAHAYDNISIINVSNDFNPLVKNPKLALMSMILSEADIAMSSGLDIEFSKLMTVKVAQEAKMQGGPNVLLFFLENICHGGYVLTASTQLMGWNFKRILETTKSELKP